MPVSKRKKTAGNAPAHVSSSAPVVGPDNAVDEADPGVQAVVTYDEAEEEPSSLFDNAIEDTFVTVNRLGLDKRWYFFYKLLPEESTTDRLFELGGGGLYRCRENVPTGSGGFVLKRQRTVRIEGDRKEISTPVAQKGDGEQPVPVGVDATQLANAETQRALLISFLEREQQRPEVKQTDWGPVVIAVLPAFLKYLIDSKSNVQPAPDPAALVDKVASVLRGNTSSTTATKEHLEMMMSFLDLKIAAKELTAEPAGGETGDPVMDTILANVPKVIGLMESQKGATPMTAPPTSTGAPVAGLPATTGEAPVWGTWLLSHKQSFIAMARDGKNPEICADSLLELILPVVLRGQLAEFMQQPDALATTLKYIPELQQYEQWTVDFLNRLFENLFGGAEVVEEVSPTPDVPPLPDALPSSEGTGDDVPFLDPEGKAWSSRKAYDLAQSGLPPEGSIDIQPTPEEETDVTREE